MSRQIVNAAIPPNTDRLTHDERRKLESELSRYLMTINDDKDHNKNKIIDELTIKISGRESAIAELERSAQDQCKTA
eukprot:13204270-Ditylum_brightwellii.AAC.1